MDYAGVHHSSVELGNVSLLVSTDRTESQFWHTDNDTVQQTGSFIMGLQDGWRIDYLPDGKTGMATYAVDTKAGEAIHFSSELIHRGSWSNKFDFRLFVEYKWGRGVFPRDVDGTAVNYPAFPMEGGQAGYHHQEARPVLSQIEKAVTAWNKMCQEILHA